MINIGIHGGSGKMGKMIYECLKISQVAKASVIYTIEPLDFTPECVVTDSLDELFKNCDVVVDFTIANGAITLLEFAKAHPKPIVMGTTGLGEMGEKLLNECAKSMPILYATNMSLGVAVLNSLAALASKALRDFDIEICEMHHRHKKDAPSGTALTLATSVAKARELDINKVRVSGRDGMIGARSKDEIAVMSLRGGDIVGRHTVGFYNDGEFIELNHTATSRATFANGAIKAAVWVVGQKPALYSINDCLGL
ncbi:4-hydroxy-tetrahydrodipicolinate reductase [Campylobacter geochelonis]|uniref:4-hydroxy-tetrahydrodipicolinate reductase n=1 Tax=Campylobacter geochelonis TaxID=1780362 RepID=A0A128EDK9_9BACT|nr:4-hydroxy-tetrahydrodipicolinate reductase [Campylobacter geochelonis]QKF70573.1 4-hydroxy-tetrahydrodipicolinate reductase [Campylobacter geochelonis]CZE46008.1 dihydrodipicolinate reductase [Campylobacter geochelonis]CZE46627.1 dihydrodipicolinate reductase [Campylobacter geochelonis]CZE50385.1 dihydrodipicolinate reductase [Campylobacter geochelonis]